MSVTRLFGKNMERALGAAGRILKGARSGPKSEAGRAGLDEELVENAIRTIARNSRSTQEMEVAVEKIALPVQAWRELVVLKEEGVPRWAKIIRGSWVAEGIAARGKWVAKGPRVEWVVQQSSEGRGINWAIVDWLNQEQFSEMMEWLVEKDNEFLLDLALSKMSPEALSQISKADMARMMTSGNKEIRRLAIKAMSLVESRDPAKLKAQKDASARMRKILESSRSSAEIGGAVTEWTPTYPNRAWGQMVRLEEKVRPEWIGLIKGKWVADGIIGSSKEEINWNMIGWLNQEQLGEMINRLVMRSHTEAYGKIEWVLENMTQETWAKLSQKSVGELTTSGHETVRLAATELAKKTNVRAPGSGVTR